MNGRGNGRGSIRNYFPGYPGYYVKSTDPLLNPQKLPLASEETCANYCKENIECCSFQYGLKRFGFWLCLMLTFSSPASAFWILNVSRHYLQFKTGCSVSKRTQMPRIRRDTGNGWRVFLVPMNVHPKRFLFSGGVCTFQLNAFSRKLITQRKTLILTPETSFSFCKELCLSMQEVAITNALSYFLIYKLRTLPRGDRYPNRFNSIFEFRQKMIQFKTISWKFNSNKYSFQYLTKKFNYKIIQFNSVQ